MEKRLQHWGYRYGEEAAKQGYRYGERAATWGYGQTSGTYIEAEANLALNLPARHAQRTEPLID